jgi:predicted nucleic acid-binding Zn ribbon protein
MKRPTELIGKILKTQGMEQGLKRGKALLMWPEVVGHILSEMSQAERLEDGVLFVRVSDAAISHQLTYMRTAFLQRYQELLPGLVQELRFQVGSFEKKPKLKPKPKPPPLDVGEEQQLYSLADQLSEKLRPAVIKAGRAVKQRLKADTNPPCSLCGVRSPKDPCQNCQKLLAAPLTKREANRLTRFPLKPRLEGDALAAAKYLALGQLQEQMNALMLEVIKQPELVLILQDTARRYLQLRTGQPQVAEHFHLLPPALQSFIKAT